MEKAIYVFDQIPNCCAQCSLFHSDQCYLTFTTNMDSHHRAKDCPLKELPKHLKISLDDFSFQNGFAAGWNACLGEIEGEES